MQEKFNKKEIYLKQRIIIQAKYLNLYNLPKFI